jgi:hypothetical protein
MRLRALLVALSLLAVAVTGCPTASPPDEACIVGGGVCFEMSNPAGCYESLPDLPCGAGYVCCTMAYGGNIRPDGALYDAPSGAPGTIDSGTPTDAGHDAGRDAHALDAATHLDSAMQSDGSQVPDGAHDGEAAKDGAAPKG